MAANWGVIEQLDEEGYFVAFHIVPMVSLDGEPFMSAAHDLSPNCPCHTFHSLNDYGFDIWSHHDPDHVGALSEEEYNKRVHVASV